ncbi:Cation/acetate symporter ActP [Poriferisphaera corsica]|uniref:Cation/acetate symporter ActP n=1 Tax=Poriferisphaera corsica TaxID=2528020 RepID=A0A517YRN6_9BACT|nr:sodium:solute symporter family protein [Poriferisphaera corsica]QDU32889.1 Cation/acetate symporter ActP [Poriferisphaera corsica]
MNVMTWTYIFVGITFTLYLFIAWRARVKDTKGFYVAGRGIPASANGMATAADWMSAASFIGMAGLIATMGYAGGQYLMGWTGGFVLLALLLAPYLRKFGHFTVPDFIGDRYSSDFARLVAVICAIFISFTYVAGQMRGVGIVFSRFLEVPVTYGVIIGMIIVFIYATLGGMKGITWTQVAQFWILITAFLIPAIAISIKLTGNPIPQLGLGSTITDTTTQSSAFFLDKLNDIGSDLGFGSYTAASGESGGGFNKLLNMFCVALVLMVGTAGLPHVIVRFYTVKNVKAARWSAFWALFFMAGLYLTAPSTAAFARYYMLTTLNNRTYNVPLPPQGITTDTGQTLKLINDADSIPRIAVDHGTDGSFAPEFTSFTTAAGQKRYIIHKTTGDILSELPHWFFNWERTGLIAFFDGDNDGKLKYTGREDNEIFRTGSGAIAAELGTLRTNHQLWLDSNGQQGADARQILTAKNLSGPDRDIIVLATPEMAELSNWIIAFIAAGALAAALSTASGLLLVISSSVAHDLYFRILNNNASETSRLAVGRVTIGFAVVIAGLFGIYPPGFVSQVVAFAFGLAAASFFPAIVLGIFSKRVGTTAAITGMIAGIAFTAFYIIAAVYFKMPHWCFGIGPQGIGVVGMIINFVLTLSLVPFTTGPNEKVQEMIASIREPEYEPPAVDLEHEPASTAADLINA